jgi:hypothetical protein
MTGKIWKTGLENTRIFLTLFTLSCYQIGPQYNMMLGDIANRSLQPSFSSLNSPKRATKKSYGITSSVWGLCSSTKLSSASS